MATTAASSVPKKRTLIETFLDRGKQQTSVDELTAYLREPITRVRDGERLNLFK